MARRVPPRQVPVVSGANRAVDIDRLGGSASSGLLANSPPFVVSATLIVDAALSSWTFRHRRNLTLHNHHLSLQRLNSLDLGCNLCPRIRQPLGAAAS